MACCCEINNGDEEFQDFVNAVKAENVQKVRKMVRKPNIANNNPLIVCVNYNKNKALATILQTGVNPNKSYGLILNTPLHIATINNNLAGIKMLLSHGADLEKLNGYRYTAFMSALENSKEEIVEFFVGNFKSWQNELNLNLYLDLVQQCPILGVLRNRNINPTLHIGKLLEAGINPNTKNSRGNSPVLEAIYTKDIKTADSMIKIFSKYANTDINYVNFEGIGPLFKVVTLDEPRLLRALLQFRSLDINQTNMFRLTSLYYAVSNTKNLEIIELLMKAGADPSICGAFTMRGVISDTASAILAAVTCGKIGTLRIFFNYGYTAKRKWFSSYTSDSLVWERMANLCKKVPSLKSLTRKTIKKALASNTKIPSRDSLTKLELPRSLKEYLDFY